MHLWLVRNKQIVGVFLQVELFNFLWYIGTPSLKGRPKEIRTINEQNILAESCIKFYDIFSFKVYLSIPWRGKEKCQP